eukprot:TRINITY_DN11324_c0_g1_i1.p1 TRINITY_DN11324_c0_g1~~TRINITY_DN11324_c0_g1_i1.p1  ORF type:complete len:236 (+),score=55.16 TRINITY_DN11324_c0_g1_i1:57-764(+)
MYSFPQQGQAYSAATHADLVERIKRGQRASMEWKQRWWDWCDANGGTRDPAKHEAWMLMQAVAQCGEPPQGPPTMPRKGRRTNPYLSNPAQSALVSQIKKGQRASSEWKARWWKWCDEAGGSTYDPARHSLDALSNALAVCGQPPADETAVPPPAPTSPEHEEFIQKVKALQRSSVPFKNAWGKYCELHGHSKRDPARHTIQFIRDAINVCLNGQIVNTSVAQDGSEEVAPPAEQ